MAFVEKGGIDAGFAPIFAERIAPEIDRLEAERKALLSRARRNSLISLIVGLALAGGVIALWGASGGALVGAIIVAVIGVIGALVARSMQSAKWTGAVSETVMPPVCDFLGDVRHDRMAKDGFPVGTLRTLGMIGSYDSSTLRDRIEGTYRGIDYTLVEARLTRESRNNDNQKSTTTVFDGLLFRIALPAPAPTKILIARNHGMVGNALAGLFAGKSGRKMPKVDTGHPDFEAAFELHAEDPDVVPGFMPPRFLDNLVAIGEAEGGKKGAKGMLAAFFGEDFFLALERKEPFLEVAKLGQPIHGIDEVLHDVFDDLTIVRRIIDRLMDDVPRA
ncbi:DUF3137 domain-containing protein [Roseisalinus antarcticus]|uniref:DUF3137 domain-containing protein n=1 Tax=Roseisalinus antarcticus TaxID=254357 RepID=A0A1Y5S6R7_9RHOB|nr:DUF3137 domain-containing protein [Roseisalinus antarcticus]SLN33792.1 hypothetical protein ROA7023_01222 [Roseisalinus antarcticus]